MFALGALLALLASAQMPPLPGVAVTLAWDASPAEEEVTAYRIYQSTVVTGPFQCIQTVTNTTATVLLPLKSRMFWCVSASNAWGESVFSPTVYLPSPAGKVEGLKIRKG
jgi:hypothetical protein